eukprot:TRINITY_DN1531_c0_g3_i2.p1 TRINITY_DN1531_c0_g3~~TRINITY_DN1531_c0_g3_i2.p1  ORF type:complete len:252 (+),score=18.15 TRINITY_DN1531_c0_g3_i2:332-1087(+)
MDVHRAPTSASFRELISNDWPIRPKILECRNSSTRRKEKIEHLEENCGGVTAAFKIVKVGFGFPLQEALRDEHGSIALLVESYIGGGDRLLCVRCPALLRHMIKECGPDMTPDERQFLVYIGARRLRIPCENCTGTGPREPLSTAEMLRLAAGEDDRVLHLAQEHGRAAEPERVPGSVINHRYPCNDGSKCAPVPVFVLGSLACGESCLCGLSAPPPLDASSLSLPLRGAYSLPPYPPPHLRFTHFCVEFS